MYYTRTIRYWASCQVVAEPRGQEAGDAGDAGERCAQRAGAIGSGRDQDVGDQLGRQVRQWTILLQMSAAIRLWRHQT